MPAAYPTPDILAASIRILSLLGAQEPYETFKAICDKSEGYFLRSEEHITYRQGTSFYLRKLGFSLPEIAGVLGYAGHGSLGNAIKRYEEKIKDGGVSTLSDSNLETILQPKLEFRSNPNSNYSRIDKLCLETLAEIGTVDPERTLEQMRRKIRGRPIRNNHLANIRMKCVFLLSTREPELSLNEIARAVGYRDHSSVYHGIRKYGKKSKINKT